MRGFGKRRGGKVILVILLFFFMTLLLVVIDQKISPIVETVAKTRAHLAVTRIVNKAVNHQINNINYEDLMLVEKDKDDKVAFLQPNTVKLNQLISSITLEVEGELEHLSAEGVRVPAGLLSGLTLLANIGPSFAVKIQPLGLVNVSVDDKFDTVGFNQSKHSITMKTNIKVGVVMPFSRGVVEVNNSFPLAESIIIGPVPQTYFDWQ